MTSSSQSIEVILNVYKLGEPNDAQMKKLQVLCSVGLGLYHSGIEINGVEYAYGGDASSSLTGVFTSVPLCVNGATYHESYLLGTVPDMSRVYEVLKQLK